MGIGTESSKDGFIYEGQYKDSKKNGQGKVVFPNGDYYQGNFKSGSF